MTASLMPGGSQANKLQHMVCCAKARSSSIICSLCPGKGIQCGLLHPGDCRQRAFFCIAGTWDLSEYGPVYALTVGPYGAVFALSWNRDAVGQPTTVAWLDTQQGKLNLQQICHQC